MTPEYLSRPHKFIRNCIMKPGKTAIGSPFVHSPSPPPFIIGCIMKKFFVRSFPSHSSRILKRFHFFFFFFFCVFSAMREFWYRSRYRVELRHTRKENIYFRENFCKVTEIKNRWIYNRAKDCSTCKNEFKKETYSTYDEKDFFFFHSRNNVRCKSNLNQLRSRKKKEKVKFHYTYYS